MIDSYSLEDVAQLLKTSLPEAQALVALATGPRERFSFQDVVLLRTAQNLVRQRVSKAKLEQALAHMRERLPAETPLSAVTLQPEGNELVVGLGAQRWSAGTGQGVFDFGRDHRGATWMKAAPSGDAETVYLRAMALEEVDAEQAIETYFEALVIAPMHADAHLNVGRLLHARRRYREAEAHYVAALVSRPGDATALFNLAVVLEDLNRFDEAVLRYQDAIRADEGYVDAYFNLSRLFEKRGEAAKALRHLKDYRRLTGKN